MLERQYNFYFLIALFLTIGSLAFITSAFGECTSNKDCKNGLCTGGSCECQTGFWGNICEYCRLRLTESQGIITDGEGKYAESATCSWLVEPQRPNTTLQFRIEEFVTECTWDHLYIYDGTSINAPLIAVISGLVRDESMRATAAEPVRIIEANSGSAFLYFYSDTHYSLNGFNISYRTIDDCTTMCNGHGRCNSSGHCVCESSWAGPRCDQPTCPTTCEYGVCNPQTRQCDCNVGYTGSACSVHDGTTFWSSITANNQDQIFKRASHGAVVIGNWMWIIGGYSLNDFERIQNFVSRYNVLSNTWEVISMAISSTRPANRYGHSAVVYNNSVIVYGGDVGNQLTDELWSFDTKSLQWSRVRLSLDSHPPLTVAGHTAVVVNSIMVVMFGYTREEYFTSSVQEFNLDTKKWSRYSSPHCIRGSYGHSSAYHPGTGLIYIHGGFRQGSHHYSVELSSDLMAYDPHKRLWYPQKSSGYPRFLHSSVVIGNEMFVFGGNTHNDTGEAQPKARCYSADFLSYDIDRNVWTKVATSKIPTNAARYGHSAVTLNSTMYVFGGFSGVMFNDILAYTVGNCSKLGNKSSCLSAHNSNECVWQHGNGSCVFPQSNNTTVEKALMKCGNKTRCSRENGCNFSRCNYSDCHSCLLDLECMWCELQQRCHAIPAYVITFPYGQCHAWTDSKLGCLGTKCSHMKTCNDCHTLPGCGWCDDGSGTGLGQCMDGGDDGATARTINTSLVKCPKQRWNFVGCPPCRCNGHSLCTNSSVCEDCQHNTRGPHCEYCNYGYYGDARNGGRCERCRCNGHAVTCDHGSGKCDCVEEGVVGDSCENCKRFYRVNARSYLLVEGNSTKGHCYIVLNPCDNCAPMKFNVTMKSLICVQSTPYKGRDLEFAIAVLSTSYAYLNFSVISSEMSEKLLESDLRIGSYERVISHKSYKFEGNERVTFRVCVYNIQPPLAFTVLFYQPKVFLDLIIFFITFFGCFFSLLLIAAIVWKIRIRWMRHVSARRRLEEQAQRASRPFAKLLLELPKTEDCPLKVTADAVTVALEPCASSNAAVVTVLMRLPTVENGCVPIGGCGIACASALVTCSNPSRTGHAVATRRKSKPHSKRQQTWL